MGPVRVCLGGLVAVALTFAAASCTPGQGDGLEPVGEARVAADKAACEKRGGRFLPVGGGLVCFTTTKDAGEQCHKASDCESACLARSMSCAPVRPLLGCQDILNAAGVRLTQCVD